MTDRESVFILVRKQTECCGHGDYRDAVKLVQAESIPAFPTIDSARLYLLLHQDDPYLFNAEILEMLVQE